MIALAASVLLAVYLIVPSGILRLIFGQFVPLRSFVRTRTEEIYRALITTAIPLVIAYVLVWTVPPLKTHPFYFSDTYQLRRQDYKVVATAFYSEQQFKDYGQDFWKALTRSSRRQGRLLAWYYVLVSLQGLGFGWLASQYGRYKGNRVYSWLADRLLFPQISEWHVLLTPFIFPRKRAVVQADILSTNGSLYQGKVSQYFLDANGRLAGLILTEPRRYDRRSYLRDKDKGTMQDKSKYWREIPSAKLYIFGNKILNLNLNYEPRLPSADILTKILEKTLGQPIRVTVTPQ